MNQFLFFMLLTSAPPLLAKEPSYLGADRADVEAGLRLYTEKQLADMKRKNREQGMVAEPVEQDKAIEPEDKKQNWDDEIERLLHAEIKKQPPQQDSPIFEKPFRKAHAEAATFKPERRDWQKGGFDGMGRREKAISQGELITIPAGSFIMADLLTGVDAPTQTSIPALIRTRVGFVSPNDGFVDLSGCHAIAQATGDLSTERVKFKTVSLSCLSPEHIPYEQAFTAYAAGEDDSFGVPGELISRQGRVATMAFLNGVVEGATKIVAQTSSTVVSPMSALSNDGSSSAAVEVVRWYLEHAKGLVPTIEVKAGAPVRLVLLESLMVPKSFFKKYINTKESSDDETDVIY